MKIKTKRLKSLLQEVDNFKNPQIELEQYTTPLDISVALLQHVDNLVYFDESSVADLGCGTGMLLLGSALLGAKFAVGIDCCRNALSIAASNTAKFDFDDFTAPQLCLADVTTFVPFDKNFDVVLTNPPFGTKNNQGTDVAFIKAGLRMLRPGGRLFSLHKSSTQNFLVKMAKSCDTVSGMECIAEMRWNLEPTYKFHTKKNVDINVILCVFEKA